MPQKITYQDKNRRVQWTITDPQDLADYIDDLRAAHDKAKRTAGRRVVGRHNTHCGFELLIMYPLDGRR